MRPPRSRRPRRVFGTAFAIAATLASAGRVYETSTIGRLLSGVSGSRRPACFRPEVLPGRGNERLDRSRRLIGSAQQLDAQSGFAQRNEAQFG